MKVNLEDLPVDFEFEYLKDWIEDEPELHKGMSADLGVSQSPLGSGMADMGAALGGSIEDEDIDILGMDDIKVEKVEFGADRGLVEDVDITGMDDIKVEKVEFGTDRGLVEDVDITGMDEIGLAEDVELGTDRGLLEDVDITRMDEIGLVEDVDTTGMDENDVGCGDDKEGQVGGEEEEEEEEVNGLLVPKSEARSMASSSSSETESSSSESESESSSDEEDDADKEVDGELEEGEILSHELDEMTGWSDDEDGSGAAALEAQRSKNELTVLPPVPPVTATLQPHHQILPVGVVLSVLGAQVIVEGVEKHNPLNEGSILWITESRSPLGLVDEIFGPVKNPYYIVRYNSESEVPSGIEAGSPISFVPEFADHVLNDKSLYQKGYDRSGPNDEEVLEDEEFSDDEKEAEYKKMLKNKKRGKNNENFGNNQSYDDNKFNNRSRNWKSDSPNDTHRSMHPSSSPMNQCAQVPSPRPPQAFAPQPFPQFGAFPARPNGMMPFQQPQNSALPVGMPQMMQQMLPQPFFQMPNPFQQQMNGPNMAPNQPGFGAGPPFMPWAGQNPFMGSPFGMVQNPFMNAGQQAPPQGFQQQAMNAGQQAPPQGFQQQAMNAGQLAPPQGFQQQAMNAGQQAPPQGFQQQAMNIGQQAPPQGFQQQASHPMNEGQEAPPPGFKQKAPGSENTEQAPLNMQNPSDSQKNATFPSQHDSSQRFNHGNQSGGRSGGRFRGGKPHHRGGGRFRGGRGRGGRNA